MKLPYKNWVPFKLDRTLAPKLSEIIWSNLRISYPEWMARFAATNAFVAAIIVFWSVPVTFVGCLSNINYLTDKVQF